MAKAEMVRVRIKRFGKQFVTCGVGVRPPENLVGDPRMKRLCPKLVPGQIIELPAEHSLIKQRKLIEVVDGPEQDEFIRPWVFKSAEDAAMANPSKSRLGPNQIMTGLSMAQGAIDHQARKLEERKALQDDYQDTRPGRDKVFNEDLPEPEYEDDDEDEFEDEQTVAKRASNRVPRKVKDEARVIEDDDEDLTEETHLASDKVRKPAAKTSRTSRAKTRETEQPTRRRRRATSD